VVLRFSLHSIESRTSEKVVVLVMVFYFTTSEGYMIYMGADKFENEDLIRYGIPEDLW
jgi:NFACT protein RNA binding domain